MTTGWLLFLCQLSLSVYCNKEQSCLPAWAEIISMVIHVVPGFHHPKPAMVPQGLGTVFPSHLYELRTPFPKQAYPSTTVSFRICEDALNCSLYLPRYFKKGILKCTCEAYLKGIQYVTKQKQTQSYQRIKSASILSR